MHNQGVSGCGAGRSAILVLKGISISGVNRANYGLSG